MRGEDRDFGRGVVERERLSASNIRSVGYDAEKRLLEIEFSSGSIVQYSVSRRKFADA
jgi:hypothetical protein